MPSVDAIALPLGIVDGRTRTDGTWLARQTRRLLVVAGLIVGCWLLAGILNGSHASAAPAGAAQARHTVAAAGRTHGSLLPAIATTLSGSAQATLTTALGQATTTSEPLRHLLTATVGSLATATHSVGVLHPGHPVTHAAHSVPATRAGAPAAPVMAAGVPASIGPRHAWSLVPLGRPASASAVAAATILRSRPAGSALPIRTPAPFGPHGVVGAGSSQSFGQGVASLPTGASVCIPFMVSAPSSHNAALLRAGASRPSFSPD